MSFIALGIGAAASITGVIIKSSRAKKRLKEAEKEKKDSQNRMAALEADRQDIVNPYAAAKDLSGELSNPMANLTVATGAAEIQMQQSDAALANTLDTLRATGAGAGGATALAQAARQSKKSIAANIEQQEAQNQKLAAQGEMNLQAQILAEKKRMQQADAEGRKFVYDQQESREVNAMNRAQSDIDQARSDFRQSRADDDASTDDAIKFVGDAGYAASVATESNSTTTSPNVVKGGGQGEELIVNAGG
tara:strand:- start:2331 stop:3077 length:747 start_codon:yes stop_codon:yes gene_type:complete